MSRLLVGLCMIGWLCGAGLMRPQGEARAQQSQARSEEINVEAYTSVSAALAAIGTSERALVIPSAQNVTSDLSIPANVTLKFTGQGQLYLRAGTTLTILGPIEAAIRPIFVGPGKISFNAHSYLTPFLKEVYPQWWGAQGNGTADDTAAIQAAIDSLPYTGGVISIPNGTYRLTAPLIIADGAEHDCRPAVQRACAGGAAGGG